MIQALEGLNALICVYLRDFERSLEDPYRGLYITSAEVQRVIAPNGVGLAPLSQSLLALIDEGRWAAPALSRDARMSATAWPQLVARAGLDRFEQGVLLLSIAPEIDLRYERVCGYLHDDVTRKRPSVELALALFCASWEERLARRAAFAPSSRLLGQGLIELGSEPERSFLATPLSASARVIDFLFGAADEASISAWARLEREGGAELVLGVEGVVHSLLQAREAVRGLAAIQLNGRDGRQRLEIARAVARACGARLLHIDLRALADSDLGVERALRRLRCEGVLHDVLLYLDGIDALSSIAAPTPSAGSLQSSAPSARLAWVEALCVALFGSGSLSKHGLLLGSGDAGKRIAALPVVAFAVPELTVEDRRQLVATATSTLAKQVDNQSGWDDLVLPKDTFALLRELCDRVRHQRRVFDDWGFGVKSSAQRGTAAMFCGPPGTGKTLAASIVARELGMELCRIDLSQLVSKYIGETEKNLANVFERAEATSCCLFFDEADSVFAKRSDVKDSHDRYANLETSYLLQRIEQFDGLVVLATNFRNNIDRAFYRRLAAVVSFPMPDESQRRQLWSILIPRTAPVASDLDLDFMVSQFAVSGGQIRNIVLGAAFLAAAEQAPIGMRHVVHAARRELQKVGRACSSRELGKYAHLVELEPHTPGQATNGRQATPLHGGTP